MTRNDRRCPNYGKIDKHGYGGMTRIYIRKTVTREVPHYTPHREEGKMHYHGSTQIYATWAWKCFSCGLIMFDPQVCIKCKGTAIKQTTSSEYWDDKARDQKWQCLNPKCGKIWTAKRKTIKVKVAILT